MFCVFCVSWWSLQTRLAKLPINTCFWSYWTMAHTNQNYEFRCLREEELDDWFTHLGTVFTVGRDYFVQHWWVQFCFSCSNNKAKWPLGRLEGHTCLCGHQTTQVHDSCNVTCISQRVVLVGGGCSRWRHWWSFYQRELQKTGVGNCSSASVLRDRKFVLTKKMAAKYMQENKYIYSLLRTAATTSPFYQQLGWEILPERFTQVSVNHNSEADCPGQVTVNVGTEMAVRLRKYESYNHLSPNHQAEVREIYDSRFVGDVYYWQE